MKTMKTVKPVALTTASGKRITTLVEDGNGQREAQVVISQKDFLLGLTSDPKLTSGLRGMVAAARALEIIDALNACDFDKESIDLENDHQERLLAVAEDPSEEFDPRWRHCLVPFGKALKDAAERGKKR